MKFSAWPEVNKSLEQERIGALKTDEYGRVTDYLQLAYAVRKSPQAPW